MNKGFAVALLLTGIMSVSGAFAQSDTMAAETASEAEALLQVPAENYREEWILLGSFSVLADDPEEGAKQLHVVYAEPATVDAYRRTGAFPDGAVLVKEVLSTKTEALTTGIVSYAQRLVGRFVMVKDAGNIYVDKSPLWGDGWGWAFYEGSETRKTVTTDYRKDCLGCHEPARSQDLVYVQGYPILNR
jgi:hypothetical protein